MSNKGFKLEDQMLIFVIKPINDSIDNVIFINTMVNGTVKSIDINIIFIPGETPKIIEYLIEMNHINVFGLYSFSIDILPIDYDLFSLDNDESLIFYLTKRKNIISNQQMKHSG